MSLIKRFIDHGNGLLTKYQEESAYSPTDESSRNLSDLVKVSNDLSFLYRRIYLNSERKTQVNQRIYDIIFPD